VAEELVEFFDLHSIASLATPRSALVLPLAVAGLFAVLVASYFAVRRAVNSPAYKLRNLSPEKIAAHRGLDEEPSPERICASIIERATQIKRALDEEPSGIEVEMCALGYRKCANDMITLTHLVNEEMPEAPFVRRWRLKKCRKRAIESLSAVRESLPPGVLKATRQEK
jgi:hypothetical protein